jgi:hypothetical protein
MENVSTMKKRANSKLLSNLYVLRYFEKELSREGESLICKSISKFSVIVTNMGSFVIAKANKI